MLVGWPSFCCGNAKSQTPKIDHVSYHPLCRSPIQVFRPHTAPKPDLPAMTILYSCRRLELRDCFFGKWSSIAPNIEELCVVCSSLFIESTTIQQIAAISSVRSLELRDWQMWDDVKPSVSLALLTRLTISCNKGLLLLADMLQPGCLQSLEVASAAHLIFHLCYACSIHQHSTADCSNLNRSMMSLEDGNCMHCQYCLPTTALAAQNIMINGREIHT